MARDVDIGDEVAITATVKKRIADRVTLSIPGYHYPYSIIDSTAKPGDKIRIEGEVIRADEGRVTIEGDAAITVDVDAVEVVRKYRRPAGTTPLRRKAD